MVPTTCPLDDNLTKAVAEARSAFEGCARPLCPLACGLQLFRKIIDKSVAFSFISWPGYTRADLHPPILQFELGVVSCSRRGGVSEDRFE
ncbi:MAG: hypothetical protein BGO06_26220 [Shinella sp. 65-6]|nr:MAG: hypothetical protein BGO06_26220 [Shinella sp. 65-6]